MFGVFYVTFMLHYDIYTIQCHMELCNAVTDLLSFNICTEINRKCCNKYWIEGVWKWFL